MSAFYYFKARFPWSVFWSGFGADFVRALSSPGKATHRPTCAISAAKKNLILAKASQGKLSHRSGDQQYSSAINTDAEPSCQSVKLNDQCEVIDEISNISVSQRDVNI